MIACTIITALCLLLLCLRVYDLVKNVLKENAHKVPYVREYKKGKFFTIYPVVFVLLLVGTLYKSGDILFSIVNAITKTVDFVVLKFNSSDITALWNENGFYRVTMWICYAIVLMNTFMLTWSLLGQRIWFWKKQSFADFSVKEKLYLFGYNAQNMAICESDKGRRDTFFVDETNDEIREKLYIASIPYIKSLSDDWLDWVFQTKKNDEGLRSWIKRKYQAVLLKKNKTEDKRNAHIFIINTGDDERNISICRQLVDRIAGIAKPADNETQKERDQRDKKLNQLFKNIKIYVFGDPQYLTIYEDIVGSGHGCISYVNKYQKTAVDFIDRHPLALYMNGNQIDYEKGLVKENVDINVVLLGFGKTNRQIFLTSVANNQFLTKGKNDSVLKQVNYVVFDKDPTENNKNLNHGYYRFKQLRGAMNPDDYLPLPELPAIDTHPHLDVNDKDFYENVRKIVTRSENDANFIVIAFGSDLENLDMAQKLVEKRKEWGAKKLIIFVKVRKTCDEMKLLDEPGCFFICNENECVFDIDMILTDKIMEMSIERNAIYNIESKLRKALEEKQRTEDEINAIINSAREESYMGWYKLSPNKRDSNIYSSLSLRSKLNMMGLDYCKKQNDSDVGLSEEKYFEKYGKDDMPVYTVDKSGSRIFKYGLELKDSLRTNMAMQEHERWNAFMISNGYIPSTREQILYEAELDGQGKPLYNEKGKIKYTNGKNEDARRHGNLTNYDGLIEFRQIIAERDNVKEADKDTIKYDFQTLDDAHRILNESGYKIIPKKEFFMTFANYGIMDQKALEELKKVNSELQNKK